MERSTDEGPNNQACEAHAYFTTIKAVRSAEHFRERLVEQENDTVDEAVVKCGEVGYTAVYQYADFADMGLNSRLAEEEDERSRQGDLEQLRQTLLLKIIIVKVTDVLSRCNAFSLQPCAKLLGHLLEDCGVASLRKRSLCKR